MFDFGANFVIIAVIVLLIIILALTIASRYKRCPSGKILVLKPFSIEANLKNALSKQNICVDVPCRFTIAISTEKDNMNNAVERLLGLTITQIQELAHDILFGQLRLVIATMMIEEINSDRNKFIDNISVNVDAELRKIGLKLINVNVTDINDETGYHDTRQ